MHYNFLHMCLVIIYAKEQWNHSDNDFRETEMFRIFSIFYVLFFLNPLQQILFETNILQIEYPLSRMLVTRQVSDFGVFHIVEYLHRFYPNLKI
jgi:hypothetical protein